MDLLEDSSLEEEVLRPEGLENAVILQDAAVICSLLFLSAGKPMRGRVDEAIIRLERPILHKLRSESFEQNQCHGRASFWLTNRTISVSSSAHPLALHC